MTTQQKSNVSALSDDEKRILLGSFSQLMGFVAIADGRYTFAEALALYRSNKENRRRIKEDLGEVFGDGGDGGDENSSAETLEAALKKISAAVDKLDEQLQEKYQRALVDSIIAVADASGGFLWFGESINEGEVKVLRRIIEMLDLVDYISDDHIKKVLGY